MLRNHLEGRGGAGGWCYRHCHPSRVTDRSTVVSLQSLEGRGPEAEWGKVMINGHGGLDSRLPLRQETNGGLIGEDRAEMAFPWHDRSAAGRQAGIGNGNTESSNKQADGKMVQEFLHLRFDFFSRFWWNNLFAGLVFHFFYLCDQ